MNSHRSSTFFIRWFKECHRYWTTTKKFNSDWFFKEKKNSLVVYFQKFPRKQTTNITGILICKCIIKTKVETNWKKKFAMQMRCTTRVNASTYWSVCMYSSKRNWREESGRKIDSWNQRKYWLWLWGRTIKNNQAAAANSAACECRYVMYLADMFYRKGGEYKLSNALSRGRNLWTNKECRD